QDNWRFLKQRWQLGAEVPADFAGIPVVHNMKSWFFPYGRKRASRHVDQLWGVAKQGTSGGPSDIDEALFDRCLALPGVSIANLTAPSKDFVRNETAYKRAILERFASELGRGQLEQLVTSGKGVEASRAIAKILTSNLVSFHSWEPALGNTDEVICDVLGEFLN